LEVIIGDNQEVVPVPHVWLTQLEKGGLAAAHRVLEDHVVCDHAPLTELGWVEIALVDDLESARVHQEFMNLPGETDVITFHHGEIVIGIEVALRQADENNEPVLRELFRYLVHGLLHLAGHEDDSADDRAKMEAAQEKLVAELWPMFEQDSGEPVTEE
jgi:probable rRNA maturation factor